jgi:hypothetical protein
MKSNYADEKITSNYTLTAYFMQLILKEDSLLYSLLNRPHLFWLTQHRFVLIRLINLTRMQHVSACT